MGLYGYIDVLIPRGGAGLIKSCVENSKVPVIETGTGNCHVYIHEARRRREGPSHRHQRQVPAPERVQRRRVAARRRQQSTSRCCPAILKELEENGVTIFADEATRALGAVHRIEPATEEDWGTEYHDLRMSVKVVSGLDEAIRHINTYGTKHSEAIVTEDYSAARRFLHEVDASAVYVNASTRFTDGGEFGLGAEIGISTQKLHARGPDGPHCADVDQVPADGERTDPRVRTGARLGIMGGTFDPIHFGHLVTAEEALVQFNLDRVVFMPTGMPALKVRDDVTPAEDRYLMTVLATASNPDFDVSRMEVDRPGLTYTVDTLRALREMHGPVDRAVLHHRRRCRVGDRLVA